MAQVIRLLPDSVANQIAAGEVIQRPASVVKELVENAVDAGATEVQIVIKDAGRTLIQIIDNGVGMSAIDVRMAFERHATSKIKEATDLFALHTFGFRGEALPSIASVAQVEVKTCYQDDEIGTYLEISGSKVIAQESIQCTQGTNISVKNLFFNIPARRKFLKSNSSEYRNILTEFERIALSNPQVGFVLMHNDLPTFSLPISNVRQRIINLLGKNMNNALVPINVKTEFVNISGFISTPEAARKTAGDQYFFTNNRYMRHPYLHKAVLDGYQKLLPPELIPAYFIYFEVDPSIIDVNIHPTKTEIKFEDERSIWFILNAGVKESLGKFSIIPSIDFDTTDRPEFPDFSTDNLTIPEANNNAFFNPFELEKEVEAEERAKAGFTSNPFEESYKGGATWSQPKSRPSFEPAENQDFSFFAGSFGQPNTNPKEAINRLTDDFVPEESQATLDLDFTESEALEKREVMLLKNRYLITTLKGELVIIDQKRAHSRVLYDRFLEQLKNKNFHCQKLLYPQLFEFSPTDGAILQEILPTLKEMGIEMVDCGSNHFKVTGLPTELAHIDAIHLFDSILNDLRDGELIIDQSFYEIIASKMALSSTFDTNKPQNTLQQLELINSLIKSTNPRYTHEGKTIILPISLQEIGKRLG